jgi:hypothetical protein
MAMLLGNDAIPLEVRQAVDEKITREKGGGRKRNTYELNKARV